MGIKQFSGEISRFLASRDAEVLCITGKWGVGKTYAWNHFLKQAKEAGKIASPKYAYVSLFGQNALDDVRYAIFENTIPRAQIGQKADLTTLKTSVDTIVGKWRGWVKFAQFVPRVGDSIMSIARLGFLDVRDQVVCIDDLERAGKNLDPRDILGLVSFLKEERGCKVVLLLNDEAFEEQKLQEFRTQLEKVADTVLRFEPNAEEAGEIGIDKALSFADWLRADCIGLGIVNIRLIKRIERFSRRLQEELNQFDPRVLQQAIHSAALFLFAKYQPSGGAPSLEFIKSFNPYEGLLGEKDSPVEPHAGWRALLRQFGWTHTDEFDAVILRGVEQGSFDSVALKAAADKKQQQFALQDKDQSFSKAWDLYHDSFDDNAEQVLKRLKDSIRNCASAITPMNLSSTVGFLKEMGRGADSKELVQEYVNARPNETREFWDLGNSPFGREVKDPDVVAAFKQKLDTFANASDPAAILERLGVHKGWNPEDESILATLKADDFYKIFKSRRGVDLRRVIYGALMFRDIGNANEKMKLITSNAEEALRMVGKESAINARRVRAYGINVEQPHENGSVNTKS